jgi:dihydrodipicolinate synthase/N-acetylneuraminate lyase
VIRGTLAAAVTPLRDGGSAFDGEAVGPLLDLYATAGLDGILALGTTGEGILFSPEERRAMAERYVAAAGGRLAVIVHVGAQTTADTAALAAHAAEAGADGVAVIGPPYFALDDASLLAHFSAAARAAAPLPFYLYEFAARSGYAVPLEVVARLREEAPNFAGLKVSDSAWDDFAPYLVDGLDVFVGPESLIPRGLEGGAVGAVSGLAAGFPELVAALVRDPGPQAGERVAAVRDALQRFPFQSALKHVLRRRGVPIEPDVRSPLRTLDERESAALDRALDDPETALGRAFADATAGLARA